MNSVNLSSGYGLQFVENFEYLKLQPWNDAYNILNRGFYKKLKGYKSLTYVEQIELAKRIEASILIQDPLLSIYPEDVLEEILVDGKDAFRELFESNLRLVRVLVTQRFRFHDNPPLHDAFQAGCIGLVKAIERWDHTLGFPFHVYAKWWINQSIERDCIALEEVVRIPFHVKLQNDKLHILIQSISDENDTELTFDILLNESDLDSNELIKILQFKYQFHSLTTRLDRYNERVFDIVTENVELDNWQEPDNLVFKSLLSEQLDAVLRTLTEREESIIRLRYGLIDGIPKTLDDIGKHHGVTRERIRQIEGKIMSKLRHPSRSDVLKDFL